MADGSTRTQAVRAPLPHDSALAHVAGAATYIDDIAETAGLLHLAFGKSAQANALVRSMDLTAVRAAPGVVAVFTVADIPGENNVGPVAHDDPLLADGEATFVGQPLFIVAATSCKAARMAALLGKVEYETRPVLVTAQQALDAGAFIEASQYISRGDPDRALANAAHRVQGELEMGGQDHFYLEGQIALATPGEDGQVHILSSTQHPSEVQHLVANLLCVTSADVTVEVRRIEGSGPS